MRITSIIRTGALALSFAGLVASAGTASASPWTANHPWRAEVNTRLAIQTGRVDIEEATGQISPWQAHALHVEDRDVRGEERLMASMNGGHLTPLEDATLNHQENVISNRIGF